MILLVDNYDSFVHNLERYFIELGYETTLLRNDDDRLLTLERFNPSALVFSPGPCSPREAGHSLWLVREHAHKLPMLGICLGHQVIVEAMGGEVVKSGHPVHGEISAIQHSQTGIFTLCESPMMATRYHSLIARQDTLPDTLKVIATLEDGGIMGIEANVGRVWGVQFHPESILTVDGYRLLENFCQLAGLKRSRDAVVSI